MKRNQSGFTLIEIAIVLVIIGLLLGGVLKGQELINSSRVKSLATDFRNIPVYIYGYQDKYRALPGDDANAVTHVSGTAASSGTTALNSGVINGNWDTPTVTEESQLFWQHIRLAGLATGATTGSDYLPTNSVGGRIGISSSSPVLGLSSSYVICSDGVQGKFARQLDTQMDDGNTDTGAMRSIPQVARSSGTALTAAVSAVATTTANFDSTIYTVCMGV